MQLSWRLLCKVTRPCADIVSNESVKACPRCQSDRIRRSHTRWWERPRRWLTGQVAYKCGQCHRRVWVSYDQPLPLVSALGGTVAAASVLTLGVVGWWALGSPPPAPQMTTVGDSRPAPGGRSPAESLALLSTRSYTGAMGDFRFLEGEVRNQSRDTLNHVEAECTWFDDRGRVLAVESSPLVEAPLLPGETSAFKIRTRNHPDLTRFSVVFRSVDGALLATFDQPATTDAVGTSGNAPAPSAR